MNDHSCAQRFSACLGQGMVQIVIMRGPGPIEQARGGLYIIDHRSQRLVQFMGQTARHCAHGAQPGDMQQFGLQLGLALLRRFMVGQVADKADVDAAVAAAGIADDEFDRKDGPILAPRQHPAHAAQNAVFARGAITRLVMLPIHLARELALPIRR